jgi:hypothetical protein
MKPLYTEEQAFELLDYLNAHIARLEIRLDRLCGTLDRELFNTTVFNYMAAREYRHGLRVQYLGY